MVKHKIRINFWEIFSMFTWNQVTFKEYAQYTNSNQFIKKGGGGDPKKLRG